MLTNLSTAGSVPIGILSMTTSTGNPEYGFLAVITLIILLSAKVVLSASQRWNTSLDCNLRMSIAPLVIVFIAITIIMILQLS